MNKISNEMAYNLIFNRGLLPPINKEYEDERMKQAVIELNELREKESIIHKTIASLYPAKYELYIDTDNDYTVSIKDQCIYDSGHVYFNSIENLENCINEVRIAPDDGHIRLILNRALTSIKSGQDFSFGGNQTIELSKI
jgi:hypothetical protein